MADPYSTLGVSRDADAAAIKSAYRKLAKELHPDRNKDNPKAAERFSQVTNAYDLLSDKEKRGQFDRGEIDEDGNPRMPYGMGGGPGGPGGPGGFSGYSQQAGPGGSRFEFGGEGIDLGDLFGNIFGGGGSSSGGGHPGGGFGQRGPHPGARQAPPPKGANVAYKMLVSFTDAATLEPQTLRLDDGTAIELKLPAGVQHGQQIRVGGKGRPGPGGNGDAMVTIEIGGHPYFERDGSAIRLDLPLSLKEAALGGKVKVPTVDGAVMLNIPKGSTSGKTLRLKGKGFSKKEGGRGDQLVRLMIALPENDPAFDAFVKDWEPASDVREQMGV